MKKEYNLTINKITVTRERLRKQNSFILNGIDSHSLVFAPVGFKNSGVYVDENFPMKASPAQCQVYLNETALDNIEDFFQIISIQTKDLKDLPIRETFYLIQENRASRRKDSNRDVFMLNMNIIPNQEVLDLNEKEEEDQQV